jgi:hypothetical protein
MIIQGFASDVLCHAFTGRRKCIGFPHLLSLRNVAHSANDGTAVYFFIRRMRVIPAVLHSAVTSAAILP